MTKIDFLPDDYIEKRAQRHTNFVCLIVFVLVTIGLGAGFFVLERRQGHLEAEVAKINAEMLKAGEALEQLEVLEKQKKQMMQKASISAALMEPVPRTLLIATVTNALPSGTSLVEYKLKTKEHIANAGTATHNNRKKRNAGKKPEKDDTPTAPPKYETTIELTGIAPTDLEVSALIGKLSKSLLLGQVNLTSSQEHKLDDGGVVVRYFKLALELDSKARASQDDVRFARRQRVHGM